jgi:hypothetical protein
MPSVKAQSSIEYILLFGISLVIVGVLWTVSGNNLESSQWDLQLAYAKNSMDKIAKTADIAYVQGQPAQMYVNVDFPDNVNAVYIQNNEIIMELRWEDMLRNFSAYSAANMTGSISPAPGRHRLLVKAGQFVDISEA